MAEQKAKIIITGEDQTKQATTSVKTGLKGVDTAAKTATASLLSMGKALLLNPVVALIAGFVALKNALFDVSKEAAGGEKSIAKLNASLRNQEIYTDTLSQSMQDYASELQKTTVYSDDQVMSLQAMLLNFGISSNKINDTTLAVMNLSAGLGMDLESAALLVSKTVNSSANAMGRYGMQVNGAAGSTERLNSVITAISSKFGGQATTEANTYEGSTIKLKNAIDDLKETFGNIENDGLKPFIEAMTKAINKTNDFFKAIGGTSEVAKAELKLKGLKSQLLGIQGINPLDTLKNTFNSKGLVAEIEKAEKELADAKKKAKEKADNEALELQKKEKDRQAKVLYESGTEEREKQAKEDAEKLKQKTKDEFDAWSDFRIQDAQYRKEYEDGKIKDAIGTADTLASIAEDGGKSALETLKRQKNAEIDAWMGTELTKLGISAWLDPTAWGKIAMVIAQGAAGKAALSAVKFAEGGIVPGTSTTGDKVPANLNSGEMVLTKQDQTDLLKMIRGGSGGGNQIIRIENVMKVGENELYRTIKDVINKGDRGKL